MYNSDKYQMHAITPKENISIRCPKKSPFPEQKKKKIRRSVCNPSLNTSYIG